MKHLLLTILALGASALPAAVTVRFDTSSPEGGPFPTDALTVGDPSQLTGRRINLQMPDCAKRRAFCEDIASVNRLDGYDLNPRLRVRFSGDIDPQTLRGGIFVMWLDSLIGLGEETAPYGHLTPVNQVFYEPSTRTAYARPDEILPQRRRFALVVTDAVQDTSGTPVSADGSFTACVLRPSGEYCRSLSDTSRGFFGRFPGRNVVAASTFTTMSVTSWMEKARDTLAGTPTEFRRGPRVIAGANVKDVVYRFQTRVDPVQFQDVPMPAALIAQAGKVAFGVYSSPQWGEERILNTFAPTAAPVVLPARSRDIAVVVYVPEAPAPRGGYPVVVFGHGLSQNMIFPSAFAIPSLLSRGYAVAAINAFGHGGGPDSRIAITERDETTTDIRNVGREIDLDRDGRFEVIGNPALHFEGCLIPGVTGTIAERHCQEQTVLDTLQLARVLKAGVDVDGDGRADLNGQRIGFVGHSMGAGFGTVVLALSPEISAGVLNAGGGPLVDVLSHSPLFAPLFAPVLGFRAPYLLNRGNGFDDNYVPRDQPVRVNNVPGAVELQDLLELGEWLNAAANPVYWALNLKQPILFQMQRGDPEMLNFFTSRLVRAAGRRSTTSVVRLDAARLKLAGQIPFDTHGLLYGFDSPAYTLMSRAAHEQIALFLQSDGKTVPDVNPLVAPVYPFKLFEIPDALPEDAGLPGAGQ